MPMHISATSSPSMDVMKILSSQMAGVEEPFPGNFSFQTTFLSAPHTVARPFSTECPSFLGPRHCGQLSAKAGGAVKATKAAMRSKRFTGISRVRVGTNGGRGAGSAAPQNGKFKKGYPLGERGSTTHPHHFLSQLSRI